MSLRKVVGARIDRLRRIRAREEEAVEARRRAIPSEVRAFVWRRDAGRCVRCGAEDDLQFDHIIPVAKGGGNAIDNPPGPGHPSPVGQDASSPRESRSAFLASP